MVCDIVFTNVRPNIFPQLNPTMYHPNRTHYPKNVSKSWQELRSNFRNHIKMFLSQGEMVRPPKQTSVCHISHNKIATSTSAYFMHASMLRRRVKLIKTIYIKYFPNICIRMAMWWICVLAAMLDVIVLAGKMTEEHRDAQCYILS